MYSQDNIDQIVLQICGKNKFFVEAGGSSPTDQSNTYLLEQNGWMGLVVEPKTDFNSAYQQIRPNTILENYALVSKNHIGDTIEGDFSQYMVGGIYNHQNVVRNIQKVPCSTLANLLEKHQIKEVDFLSLDVEGYEIEILEGIDFEKCFIHLMVLENHSGMGSCVEKLQTYDPKHFNFVEEFGFKKINKIGSHEFFLNTGSKYDI